jgi:hypothetical protein
MTLAIHPLNLSRLGILSQRLIDLLGVSPADTWPISTGGRPNPKRAHQLKPDLNRLRPLNFSVAILDEVSRRCTRNAQHLLPKSPSLAPSKTSLFIVGSPEGSTQTT